MTWYSKVRWSAAPVLLIAIWGVYVAAGMAGNEWRGEYSWSVQQYLGLIALGVYALLFELSLTRFTERTHNVDYGNVGGKK